MEKYPRGQRRWKELYRPIQRIISAMRAEEDAAVDGDPAIDFNVGEGILKETWMVGGQ